MDKQQQFLQLKKQWKAADETARKNIDKQISALLDSMNDNEAEDVVIDDFKRIHNEAEDIKRTLLIREKFATVAPFLSVSKFAENYFGRTRAWFFQRLNGNIVNGKAAYFTDRELHIFNDALHDIAAKLQKAAV